MSRQRKTKREKIISQERKQQAEGFAIKDEWLTTNKPIIKTELDREGARFFKADLTKTAILTNRIRESYHEKW
ncbi:MAG: hypothetical protein UX47_C0007G0155 [Candidatus Collierbacteria bacterium GW2011_GWA2_46_26]|uniref:Uncharacterized protein n=1 Tax=Candidatus Collierbacteria bacterium GW2011_GWA2_46_26 TaxID=1618381 RepID=A0A0G1PJI7_9BACT|nr:MAG: hypothetical protein UX47_C0007G0155 [Candidatus Collierbacteria bacterium GW2011_GWA2_46_26]